MSIERELLKRFMTELKTEEDVVSLFNDIKECLAQPEPEERQRISKAYSTRAEQVAFEEGIIFAKILYGIGGGE
jgi:hypothetical protein